MIKQELNEFTLTILGNENRQIISIKQAGTGHVYDKMSGMNWCCLNKYVPVGVSLGSPQYWLTMKQVRRTSAARKFSSSEGLKNERWQSLRKRNQLSKDFIQLQHTCSKKALHMTR